MESNAPKATTTWVKVFIALLSVLVAAYGLRAIFTQHHVGKARNGNIVESTGAGAIGMGFFFVGGALLFAALALPKKYAFPVLTIGSLMMVSGLVGALAL